MRDEQPEPSRFASALLWLATIAVPLLIAAVILGALSYGLWLLSHFNDQ
ncbi:MAG: hypothetical protein ACRD2I_10080 [Vicinamibacterales bacterium]